jgi:hypothetical protein
VSNLPAFVAAQGRLIFPKVQTSQKLRAFFLALSLSLFDSSSVNGNLIGHIKLYVEGNSKSVIRANVTGRRESAQVEIRNFHPEKEVKVWLNIIAYRSSEETLRRSFLRALFQLAKEHKVKLRGFRGGHEHSHQ